MSDLERNYSTSVNVNNIKIKHETAEGIWREEEERRGRRVWRESKSNTAGGGTVGPSHGHGGRVAGRAPPTEGNLCETDLCGSHQLG